MASHAALDVRYSSLVMVAGARRIVETIHNSAQIIYGSLSQGVRKRMSMLIPPAGERFARSGRPGGGARIAANAGDRTELVS